MNDRRIRVLAWLTTAALGCAPPGVHRAVVKSNVSTVRGVPGVDLQVSADQLLLPTAGNEELLTKQPGDILVNGEGSGFLRRIMAVTPRDGQIVIDTDQAALTDLFEEGRFTHQIDLVHDAKTDGPALQGISFHQGSLTLGGDVNGSVVINDASFELQPTLDLNLEIAHGQVSEFDAQLGGSLKAALDVTVKLQGTLKLSYAQDLWKSPPAVFVQWVGPVPLVEVATVSVGVGTKVSGDGAMTVTGGGEASADLGAGLQYKNGSWTTNSSNGMEFTGHGPTFDYSNGHASFGVFAYVKVNMLFYDFAGPYMKLQPSVSLNSSADCYAQEMIGLDGLAGGQLSLPKIFGGTSYGALDAKIFSLSQPLGPCLVPASGGGAGWSDPTDPTSPAAEAPPLL